jgi:hypothetical protein
MSTENDTAKAPTEWEETRADEAYGEYKQWEKEKGRRFAKRPGPGRTVWRGLPPMKGKGPSPFRKVYVHILKDASDQIVAQGLCPSKMHNQPCLVCQEGGRLKRTGDKQDRAVADGLRAEFHIYLNVVDLEADKPEVTVMDVPIDVYKTLNDHLDPKNAAGFIDWSHPEKGCAFVVTRTGTTKNDTKYTAALARNSSRIPNMEWLAKLNDLDEAAGLLDTERAKALFTGQPMPGGAVSGAAPAPASRQLPPQASPAAAPSQDMVEDPITGHWIPKGLVK